MPISSVIRDADLLTFSTTGKLTRDEIISGIREHYPTFFGRSTLWDFSNADVTGLTQTDFGLIAAAASSVMPRGVPRKTGYVVSNPASYVIACKYLNEAVNVRLPAEYAVFNSVRAARDWLGAL